MKNETTWFVVADGSRARFLAPIPGERGYRILASYESQEARLPSRELVSTPPSHAQESANPARHAIEPRQNPHAAQKVVFAHELARHLKVAGERGDYDRLVLYADPRSLAVLRGALDPVTRSRVKVEIAKDLTKVPVAALSRHFAADMPGQGPANRPTD